MSAKMKGVAALVFAGLLAVGCAGRPAEPPPRATFGELRAQLDGHLDACTEAVGVDPRDALDAGDYELVAGERAWLDCAYEGIEGIMVPGSDIPEMYRSLIAESRAMTDRVERGEATRDQRRARIEELVAEIEDAELAIMRARELAESEEQRRANEEELRTAFDEVREMALPRRRRR